MGKVICLWASPRNISTALMYSFSQRSNTKVIDEPFYAYYLSHINPDINHPGKKEILNSQPNDFNRILQKIDNEYVHKVLFIKNMTHHLNGIPLSFAYNWINIILTRNPIKSISSFSKVIKHPTQNDIGYKLQYEAALQFKKLKANFYILDADKLLSNPKLELKKLCNFCSINFDDKMLKWPQGGIKEDGIWAKYWYKNVHASTSFKSSNKDNSVMLEKSLYPLLKECNIFYDKLIKMRNEN